MSNERVFQFWRAIEALTPQDLIRLDAQNRTAPVYGIPNVLGAAMPWTDEAHSQKGVAPGCQWRYAAQCGIYSTDALTELMLKAIGEEGEVWRERNGGATRLFDLSFDAAGFPVAQSFALSLAAWSAGQILRDGGRVEFLQTGGASDLTGLPCPDSTIPSVNSGFTAFDDLSRMLAQWVADGAQDMRSHQQAANADWLQQLIHMVARHCSLPLDVLDGRSLCRIKAVQTKKDAHSSTEDLLSALPKSESVDILSSFYVDDLRRVGKAWGDAGVGKGLTQFISAGTGKNKVDRVDVRETKNTQAVHNALRPERMPVGRWPSDHALVFSQQLAVNEAWAGLANDAGMFAVNGPPGTGKTTLLRDVVAAVVTQRAAAMIRSRTGNLGAKSAFKLGDVWVPYYPLHANLQGQSIVVASSGNGAVENVTLELPGVAAVPERVAKQANYFTDIARNVTGKDAWALIAAPLGNRKNRTEFLNKFWWGERPSKDDAAGSPATGLREHLKAILQGSVTPAMTWDTAVGRYKAALAREQASRSDLARKVQLPEQIAALTVRLASDNAALQTMNRSIADRQKSLGHFNDKIRALKQAAQQTQAQVNEAQQQTRAHQESKPGFLLWVASLGRAQRQWQAQNQVLVQIEAAAQGRHETGRAALTAQRRERDLLVAGIADISKRLAVQEAHQQQTLTSLREHEHQLRAAQKTLGSAWPNESVSLDERERIEPWAQKDWLQAREDIFLAALDVHRAFIECHPTEMLANLNLASDWLSGKAMPPELARTALDSLCLVVPVISTTFASVPRMFASMAQESIGWLLIDEAAQAQVQHAAGAIWRAKRTIVVGDPRQLEPVCSMPSAIEAKLASIYKIDPVWWPSHTSTQSLADLSARLGTRLMDHDGQHSWVGAPLRLHRRCDEPMFSISNNVAYAGMMVQGKQGEEDKSLPQSRWFDVQADLSEGHWVHDEGQQARAILDDLIHVHGVDRGQIALLSPFRDCAQRLKALSEAYGLHAGRVGTVHTAQGKEADVLVLVLGGNPRSPGAKSWAAAKPNLVNVAVSRAKKRLYVVGNREQWAKQKHFATLAELLPA
jgi:uncharacterized coiled-coil protein SlyX